MAKISTSSKTSDGADAGHVEYIVIDPNGQRIVSTVVTGGAMGERLVAVPYSSFRYGSGREVTLTEITREKLIAAPVIERSTITSSTTFEPADIERSYTHFGVRIDATDSTRTTTRTDVNPGAERTAARPGIEATTTEPTRTNAEVRPQTDPAHPAAEKATGTTEKAVRREQ